MTEEGLINSYHDKLLKTSTPHLILATAFKDTLGRDLKKTEWAQLKKLINVYGKWIVLESMIRTAISTTFDNDKSPFGYLNAVCMSISKENLENLKVLERSRLQKEKTSIMLEELSKPNPDLKLKEFDGSK